jgi:DNA invertase Pin-like site-specific DNA recombinase
MSPKKPKRVALYLRVSTSEQTTRNQRRELHAVAERHGWEVVATYEDAGISGAKGRDKRPGFDRLMVAVARREIDMVAAWSVDRLGRPLTDLLSFLTDLHARASICSCISRVSIHPPRPVALCFRCSACSRSSSVR